MKNEKYLVAVNKTQDKIYASLEWVGTDSTKDEVLITGLTRKEAVEKVKQLKAE
jgi:hypothetical protein